MKKAISIVFLVCVLFSISIVVAKESVNVVINGNKIVFEVEPIIVDGRTLVPIRAVCEAMGADVYWDEIQKVICIVKNDKKLLLGVDSRYMTSADCKNFKEFKSYTNESNSIFGKLKGIELEAPPTIYNGRTLLPIRAVCEELGATVKWDQETLTVAITCNDEIINNRNKDTEFFKEFVEYSKEMLKRNVYLYNHRGTIEIELVSGKIWQSFASGLLKDMGESNINIVNDTYDGKTASLDIEFTDNIDIKKVISDFLNDNTNITVRDKDNNIVFDMKDFSDVGFYTYEMEFFLSLKITNVDIANSLYLYVDDKYIGKCILKENELGNKFISAKLESDKKGIDYLAEVSTFAKRINQKGSSMKIAKMTFNETQCVQYDKNLIVASSENFYPIGRKLAEKLGRNFGLSNGVLKQDFESGYVDILIMGYNDEKYAKNADYQVIGVIMNDKQIFITIHAKDKELYEEIKSAIKQG